MIQTFLNLPESTIINKSLPKNAIYQKFAMSSSEQIYFDKDISRVYIASLISPETFNLKTGKNIQQFYILQVQLKTKDYTEKNIIKLTKLIPQNMIFALEHENLLQLAVVYKTDSSTKFIHTDWKDFKTAELILTGLDLDSVYENCIRQIASEPFQHETQQTLQESLEKTEHKKNLQKKICALQNKIRKEKQFNIQVELKGQLRKLEAELNE